MWTLCSVLMHQLRTFRSESSDDSYLSILSGLFPPSELCTVTNSHVWTVYFQVKQSIQQLPVYIILPLPLSELCTVTNSHVWTVYFQVREFTWQLLIHIILPLPVSELCIVTNSHVWTVCFQVREFTRQLPLHLVLPLPQREVHAMLCPECVRLPNSHCNKVALQQSQVN